MTCGKYLKQHMNYDPLDPEQICEALKQALTTEDLDTCEKRLFVVGTIINDNKEHYIQYCKKLISQLKTQLDTASSRLKSAENQLARLKGNVETSKKKIVVVKKHGE